MPHHPRREFVLKPGTGGSLGMVIDEPQEGDEVISRDDAPLLILDRRVAPGLHDLVVDYQVASSDDLSTSEDFVLRHPLAND